ncbi:flagellar biosynthesis protein FlhF [Geothermobacter ehrlichii]|uniref:Flagellar biosynthesis protein FlhF n=1 Tax=Geothermobacter ehrlichii TaxID=213224 RepID=A0A5D3WNP7_9BACT|nr:flagellar biosynthesis protein FlhF [Geothermobacter ehrlichii]TYP00192.1 flagellar biosynthesis protein FlhF [Geothermobacter ehrlichii]
MQVKVFEADSMAAALKKVKETFGPDALILSTRTIRKNGLGLLGRPRIEITAAIEEDDSGAATETRPVEAPAGKGRRGGKATTRAAVADRIDYRDIWRQRKVIDPVEAEIQSLREQLARQDVSALRSELEELKAAIRELNRPVQQPAPQPAAPVQPQPPWQQKPAKDAVIEQLVASLKAHDLEDATAETLARYAGERLHPQQLADPSYLNQFFLDTISDLVQFTHPFAGGQGQKRLALVGPTGVGKTTTIAKLAASYLQRHSGRLALFTIDTYRIAAAEQLRVYGEIMNLPVEVIYSPEQLQTAFARHSDKDLILIDTSGRCHRDEAGMAEIAAFLGPEARTENHLVLATGTRGRDLVDIVGSFRRIPLASLIFSKVDETAQRGALLDIPLRQNLPISCLTNGQRVPEDILAAEPKVVAECILGQQ